MSARTRFFIVQSLLTATLTGAVVTSAGAESPVEGAKSLGGMPPVLQPPPVRHPSDSAPPVAPERKVHPAPEPAVSTGASSSNTNDGLDAKEPSAALTINPARTESSAKRDAPVSEASIEPSAPIVGVLSHLNLTGWQPVVAPNQDGDSEKVLMLKEYGCKNIYARSFQRGQRRINAVVYCFNSSQGAYGAYNLMRRGSSTVVAKGDASSEDDQSISVWKDKYFISVSGTAEDDEESKTAVSNLGNQLVEAVLTHGQLPQSIMRLPTMDRVRGSEKLVMGPASARKFFPAPSLTALSFANATGGGIADYAFQAPFHERMKLMVVDYANSISAQQAYEKYVAAIEEQHPNVAPDDSTGRALFKLANSMLLCELRSQRILLISGAHKKSAPLMLARQIL